MKKKSYLQKYVANKVKRHRQSQGLSQEKLSEKAGLGQKYINQIENQNHNLSLQTLEKVIQALGLTPEEFFDFGNDQHQKYQDLHISLRRLNMKIKQLPKSEQETFIRIFEEILDNLD